MTATLLALALLAAPPTRPAEGVDALQAQVRELRRQEIERLRSLLTLADAAGDTTARRFAYRRLSRLEAATPDDRLALAVLSLKAGDLDEARTILAEQREHDAADLRIVHLLAEVERRAGKQAESDALLGTARTMRPADKAAHLAAGDFLAATGLVPQAEDEWRRVIAIKAARPAVQDVEAHLRLANLARLREDHPNAVEHLRAALKLAEDDLDLPGVSTDWLTVELAMALRDADRIDEARPFLPAVEQYHRERLERDPTDATSMNALGWFYAGVGKKLDEGIALLEKAVALRPKEPAYLDTLAELHFRKGDPNKALALIDKAIALKPDNLDYYRRQRAKFNRAIGATREE